MWVPASLIVAAAIVLSGCGEKVIKPEGAAKVVVNLVSARTPFTPKDVKCPSGQKAKVGVTFDCHFTGPEGPYVAHMRVVSVKGESVRFRVDTARAG
jgi:hypothetical protein